MELYTEIQYMKGVGPKRAQLLEKLGVYNAEDLLRFFPRAYVDWSKITPIDQAIIGDTCCICAILDASPTEHRVRKGMTLYKAKATDGTAVVQITWFNNPYLAQKLQPGVEYYFYGKMSGTYFHREMSAPQVRTSQQGNGLLPVYPLTQGLTPALLEKLIGTALDEALPHLPETLPTDLRERYLLCGIQDAIRQVHRPTDMDMLLHARRRLVFEELLMLQLGLMRLKGRNKSTASAVLKEDFTNEFFDQLPFNPTNAQRRAAKEAVGDMMSPTAMCRLLQGDVGSGKTAVAAALIYASAKNGLQSAIMAPTEILARQHAQTLEKLLDGTGVQVALLTGSMTAAQKRKVKEGLADGTIGCVAGTHALIQQDVVFASLGLVVVDEQHRFGVEQRAKLSAKGGAPHMLVMSATPIPRTLALIIYGDLDLSILDELPAGRQKIETFAVNGKLRERAYNYIKKHLDEGRQGYIVCPLVEESETLELAAATEFADKLAQGAFCDYRLGLLHGKMKPAEKEKVMADFASGKVQLLVSTTVVEVGVDVPNAVIMVIENAERFGLSQLHQLRGRVGRGQYASTCILISDAQNPEAKSRLKTLCNTTDGFAIARADLQQRGPGDFFGARQHGLPELHVADMSDTGLLEETRQAAALLHQRDPLLEAPAHQNLYKQVQKMFSGGALN